MPAIPPQYKKYIQRGVIGFVAFVILLCVGTWAWTELSNNPQTLPGVSQPQIESQQQPDVQTDLQKAVTAFGPFEPLPAVASDQPDTRIPAVLLLKSNGLMQASSKWTVSLTQASWSPGKAYQVVASEVKGQFVTIKTSNGNVYTIRCEQPFLVEEYPQTMLYIDAQNQLWNTTSTRATLARQAL